MAASSLVRIDPPFWWTGMKSSLLQLLVYGDQISSSQVQIIYPGLVLTEVHRVENPNYLFLDIHMDITAQPGSFNILFNFSDRPSLKYEYRLQLIDHSPQRIQGVSSKDLIYLIMPDRFANGDLSNDQVEGMQDQVLDRSQIYARHGGDIQGIINHLDYLADLGITTIWTTPEVENNQPEASYHGYAVTDHYKIDPRLGTNELYCKYVQECHQRGIKVIKDLVHNHVGSQHWFILDLPSADWINQWPEFTRTSHREATVMDPYASKSDLEQMLNGWFDHHMPDLNQKNILVQNYLIQNHIWWIAYAGIDGLRLDTYPYNQPEFMAAWAERLRAEFPRLSVFGETVVTTLPAQAFFTQGDTVNRGLETHLPGITDIVLRRSIFEALNGINNWNDGLNRLYTTLSLDFLYQDASRNVVFLDNHDVSRMFSMLGEDMRKFKSGIAILLTTRGIPQIYYGTEILMKNFSDPDGMVRSDFPGGWPDDPEDKFTESGRSPEENEAFNYLKALANYRKGSAVLQTGKLMQYVPEDDVYVYFRYNGEQTVMVIVNANDGDFTLRTKRFYERMEGVSKAKDVVNGEFFVDISMFLLPGKTTLVLELMK